VQGVKKKMPLHRQDRWGNNRSEDGQAESIGGEPLRGEKWKVAQGRKGERPARKKIHCPTIRQYKIFPVFRGMPNLSERKGKNEAREDPR